MIYATDPTRSSHASLAAEAAHSDLRLQKWTMSLACGTSKYKILFYLIHIYQYLIDDLVCNCKLNLAHYRWVACGRTHNSHL